MRNCIEMQGKDNRYSSSEYTAPHRLPTQDDVPADDNEQTLHARNDDLSFSIRHLKQGATGAVRTWPVAEVLLDYLVRRGGLVEDKEKIARYSGISLDLTCLPPLQEAIVDPPPSCYNILELGAGSGYLGVGLSISLNDDACHHYNHAVSPRQPFHPRVRIMCTDNDKNTVKNMRHNIANQPRDRHMHKSVRVESLDWADGEIGGDKFSEAVGTLFREKGLPHPSSDDPVGLATHMIASDVLFGETTLGPLSSIISAVKLRNPEIAVILLLTERKPDAVAELKSEIESKVNDGMVEEKMERLRGFSVSVRDVLHKDMRNMKMVEC